jgi:diacylglycerol kinase
MIRMQQPNKRTWAAKFADAFRGIGRAARQERCLQVHLAVTAAVLAAAAALRVGWLEWTILLLCIMVVLAAELGNSALEELARALGSEYNQHIRAALDMAAGMVLVTALGAVAVGAVIFIHRVGSMAVWW